jgi:phosphatidate phosphatase APP1
MRDHGLPLLHPHGLLDSNASPMFFLSDSPNQDANQLEQVFVANVCPGSHFRVDRRTTAALGSLAI